ncbi:MAG: hypothetical protein NTU51_11645 [Bacteroidetes bacterium]|nr:hypothetical protein [Bacteroidota bacterium]
MPLALILLRFFSVSIITFLLLAPLIRRTSREVEKPVIAIGIDGSRSVVSSTDSVNVRKNLIREIQELSRSLSDRFDVASYTFGENVSIGLPSDFKGTHTDISEFFNELAIRYANRNLGAVIIATDGIYNKGSNPYYTSLNLGAPVYSVSLGDTSRHKDVLIRNINVSKQVYLGDEFPFEIMVGADKYEGKEIKLIVKHSGETVFSRMVKAYNDHSLIRVTGSVPARQKGMQRYSVELETAGDEFSKANNRSDFYVEVFESRIRVALVYESPHPDIAAIVSALGASSKFLITQLKPAGLQIKPGDYDLVIFYQLPSVNGTSEPAGLLPEGIPVLFVIGSQTDLSGFNRIKTGLVINSQRKTMTDIQPLLNPDFSLFSLDREFSNLIAEFPPLQCPAGTYETGVMSDVLLFQKIGNVPTKFPMIMFFDTPQRKTGIISGENIWRWRISDFIKESNFNMFDDMVCRIAQYLAVRNDPSPFRIKVKSRLEEGDPLEFDATLLNPGHELVNTPDVNLDLKNEEGKTYPYLFTRTEKSYYLNAGYFPAGDYTYSASVKTSQAVYIKHGQISITPLDIEFVNLTADHSLLMQISSKHEGKVVRQNEITSLSDILKSRKDIKPLIHLQKKYTDLAGELWMFILILLLLFTEWAVRKRNGI